MVHNHRVCTPMSMCCVEWNQMRVTLKAASPAAVAVAAVTVKMNSSSQ